LPVVNGKGLLPMKILIASYDFHPLLGGIATSSSLLAQQFVASGHEVRVVTTTRGADSPAAAYRVVRSPGPVGLWRQVTWCDLLLSVHLSLRLAWPLALIRRPWVIAHHSWLTQVDGSIGWIERFKRRQLRRATCISVSQAVANHVDAPSVIIGPPYDDEIFHRDPSVPRQNDLLFVGRLVSGKGLNILLEAMVELRRNGRLPRLTVVGSGPGLEPAQALARQLGIADNVKFIGPRTGPELRQIYCGHHILVVPSITPETFGIVALEGIACGCVVVGSDAAGGLTDAIGPCGEQFKMGDAKELALCLAGLLTHPEQLAGYQTHAAGHVRHFTAERVAGQYLKIIEDSFATFRAGTKWLLFFACLGLVQL
jgi:glycosyltransferase involved in cell wall biosynthesis